MGLRQWLEGHRPTISSETRQAVFAVLVAAMLVATPGGFLLGGLSPVQSAAAAETVLDDFEDGNINEWSKTGSGGYFDITTDSYEGTYGMVFTATNGRVNTLDISDTAYKNVSMFSKTPGCGDADDPRFGLDNAAGTFFASVTLDSSCNVQDHTGSNIGVTVSTGTWYEFSIENIDYSANEYDIVIRDTNENIIGSKKNIAFANGANTIGQIDVGSSGPSTKWDYFRANVKRTNPVSGYVTDGSGDGISGATVDLNQSGSQVQTTTTNTSGGYKFTGVSDGTYDLNASADGYFDNSTTISVSGSPITQNITLTAPSSGFRQGWELVDHTRHFDPSDSELVVYEYHTDGFLDAAIYDDSDWKEVSRAGFNHNNVSFHKMSEDAWYSLEVRGDGAVYELQGITVNESDGIRTIEIGEPTEGTPTPTPTPGANFSDRYVTFEDLASGGWELTYDGPPVSNWSYNVTAPDGTQYTGSEQFDEPTEWYTVNLSDHMTNGTGSGSWGVDYSGAWWSSGETFNGSDSETSSGGVFAGPTGRSGGGGGGLERVGGYAILAGGAYLAYRRYGSGQLRKAVSGAAKRLPGFGGK